MKTLPVERFGWRRGDMVVRRRGRVVKLADQQVTVKPYLRKGEGGQIEQVEGYTQVRDKAQMVIDFMAPLNSLDLTKPGALRNADGSLTAKKDIDVKFTGDEEGELADAKFEASREIRRQWENHMKYGLTMGEVSLDEAEKAGFYIPSGRGNFKPVPQQTLYHATTALDAVLGDGLKTPMEIKDPTQGLGNLGALQDSISTTEHKDYAERIAELVATSRAVAADEITTQQLLDRAESLGITKEKLVDFLSSEGGEDFFVQLEDGVQSRMSMGYRSEEEMNKESYSGGGWMPDPQSTLNNGMAFEHPSIPGRFLYWKRYLDEMQLANMRLKLLNAITWLRQDKENPVMTGIDAERLLKLDPKQIGVVEVKPKPNVHGEYLPGEYEWRLWTGDALDKPKEISRSPSTAALSRVVVPPYLRRKDGKIEDVEGYTYTRTPGLVVQKRGSGWVVVHEPSGKPVTTFEHRTRKAASDFAGSLSDLADWTKEQAALVAMKGVPSAIADRQAKVAAEEPWLVAYKQRQAEIMARSAGREVMDRAAAEKWVQGSKVTHDVYRVTTSDESGQHLYGRFGAGLYFAMDQDSAEFYQRILGGYGAKTSMMVAKVRVKNPLVVDSPLAGDVVSGAPIGMYGDVQKAAGYPHGGATPEKITEGLRAAGYDGVIVRDHTGTEGNQVLVFDPSQVATIGPPAEEAVDESPPVSTAPVAWTKSLTPDEVKAAQFYKGTGYKSINQGLRHGGLSDLNRRRVDLLDSAIRKGALPKDTKLYRQSALGAFGPDGPRVGQVVRDDGFVSTSLRRQLQGDYRHHAKTVITEIAVPAGTHGAWMDRANYGTDFPLPKVGVNLVENEFTLARGTSFEVVRVWTGNDGLQHVALKVVP